jgi:hypothetical protein
MDRASVARNSSHCAQRCLAPTFQWPTISSQKLHPPQK